MKKLNALILSASLLITSVAAHAATGRSRADRDDISGRRARTEIKTSGKDRQSNPYVSKSPVKAPPQGSWVSIGQGTYLEDLLTYYYEIPLNLRWQVEIEECSENPGWYRFIPYGEGSPIAEHYGYPDNTYMYINATDPEKVYAEDFWPYEEEISNLVPETGWPENYMRYGFLADGIITFMPGSFGIGVGSGWQQTTNYTGMMLALPGASLPDETLTATSPYCADNNEFEIKVEVGGDIKELYMHTVDGEWPIEYYDPYQIVDEGVKVEPKSGTFTYKPESSGIYTVLFAGLDDNGDMLNATYTCVIAVFDEPENWEPIGRGKMSESIFSSVYNEIDIEELEFDVEESISTPGIYRLVNPYAGHSVLWTTNLGHNHNHYMIINASDPDRVYVEPYAVGIEYLCGESAIWSRAGSCLMEGVDPEDIEYSGYYGKLEDGVITFPDYTMMLSEKEFYDGEFLCCGIDFRIELPKRDGIDNINADTPDDGRTAIYNLHGVMVNGQNLPAGIYLEHHASGKVTKKVIK